jgi:cell division GTPase FtsZ
MKILAVGIGACGGRIADEFERMNRHTRSTRGLEIVVGSIAVDTDAAALSELRYIKPDYRRRILLGIQENGGSGNIAVNTIGAEIFKKEAEKVVDALRLIKRYQEADAILVIASGAGGTGSGGMPIILQSMKERYVDKAVYGLVVLPFDHEIQGEERFITNTASCLKSSYAVSDGVFLFDNQKHIQQDSTLIRNMVRINQLIIKPFYYLLCAGEEKNRKHIGSKLMDAGDIIQTVKGWTVIGHGESSLPFARRLMLRSLDFDKKSRETDIGIQVMEEAISRLSMKCSPSDGDTALYLLAAPAREISMDLLKTLGDYMKNIAADSTIRSGDYPISKNLISVDVVFSQLEPVERVREIYEASVDDRKKEPDLTDKV